MGIHVDASEVRALARDMAKAPSRMNRSGPRVMKKGAVQIKKGMAADFADNNYYPYISSAVNFDDISDWEKEIGVDKHGPQGGLGNILAFGTSNNAAVVDHVASLRRETPILVENLADAAEAAVFGGEK